MGGIFYIYRAFLIITIPELSEKPPDTPLPPAPPDPPDCSPIPARSYAYPLKIEGFNYFVHFTRRS